MLIQMQYNKLILFEIKNKMEIQKAFSLLNKQKKPFQNFQKEP